MYNQNFFENMKSISSYRLRLVSAIRTGINGVSPKLCGDITLSELWLNKNFSIPILAERINIEITDVCNLRCDYCTLRLSSRKQEHMPVEKFRSLMDELLECLDRRVYFSELHLYVLGEPLLHPKLQEILSILKDCKQHKHFPKVVLQTNATTLDSKIAQMIAESGGIDVVGYSIDGGNAKDYTKNRHHDFDSVVENALQATAIFKKSGVTTLLITIIEDEKRPLADNFKRLSDMVDVYKPRGIHNWNGQVIINEKIDTKPVDNLCGHLYSHSIAVLASGSITTCCFDWNGDQKYPKASIYDALQSNYRKNMIVAMINHRRSEIAGCEKCR